MTRQILLLFSTFAFASAYTYTGDLYGFGGVSETAFQNANQNPNDTRSVPFLLGDMNFTLRVNTAEFVPTGADTDVENPRVAASFYELEWSGGSSLNDTVGAAENITDNQSPRLCVSIPLGLYSASITNGYSESDDGDCSGALGNDCANDLKKMSYDLTSGCSGSLPSSCLSKVGTGGVGTSSILSLNGSQSSNTSESDYQISPSQFAYYASSIYSAGNDSFYEREVERLHVVILSGTETYPVCLRVKNDHVSRGDSATSAAAKSWAASVGIKSLALTLGAALFLL